YAEVHKEHFLLFLLPAVTAGMTAYYMFRLWFLAFTGTPRDTHVHEHAHESPWVMTGPLVFLAVCSVCVAWGWPLWDPHASKLAHLLDQAQSAVVDHAFKNEIHAAHEYQTYAGGIALAVALAGALIAGRFFYLRPPSTEALFAPLTGLAK